MVLQILHHARGTQTREVPVVADVLAIDRHVVGVTFDEHIVVFVVHDDLGNLRQRLFGTAVDLVGTALVEHVVGQRDVDNTLQHLHINLLQLFLRKRTSEVVGENHVQRVALRLHLDEMTDVLVRLIDLIDELVDGDVVLRSVGNTLVERLLQTGVSLLLVFELLLLCCEGLLKRGDAGIGTGELFLCGHIARLEFAVFILTVHQVFLAGAARREQTYCSGGNKECSFLHIHFCCLMFMSKPEKTGYAGLKVSICRQKYGFYFYNDDWAKGKFP